jgi:ribosomal protein S18 acetylase RimI-like enzyme
MSTEMIVVPASHADVGDIVSLVNSAYRGEGAGWTNEVGLLAGPRTDPATLAATLAAGKGTMLLLRAPDGAQLAGCVSLEPTGETATWHLAMLTVDPRRQAEGLGRALLAKAEDYLRAQGASRVRMTVISLRSSLIAWYERRGYRRTGESEPFPYGDERVGVPLRDDLHFVVLDKATCARGLERTRFRLKHDSGLGVHSVA